MRRRSRDTVCRTRGAERRREQHPRSRSGRAILRSVTVRGSSSVRRDHSGPFEAVCSLLCISGREPPAAYGGVSGGSEPERWGETETGESRCDSWSGRVGCPVTHNGAWLPHTESDPQIRWRESPLRTHPGYSTERLGTASPGASSSPRRSSAASASDDQTRGDLRRGDVDVLKPHAAPTRVEDDPPRLPRSPGRTSVHDQHVSRRPRSPRPITSSAAWCTRSTAAGRGDPRRRAVARQGGPVRGWAPFGADGIRPRLALHRGVCERSRRSRLRSRSTSCPRAMRSTIAAGARRRGERIFLLIRDEPSTRSTRKAWRFAGGQGESRRSCR
jgi:hypothetical protein